MDPHAALRGVRIHTANRTSHTGPHGLGQKSPDSSAIPLCYRHHRTGPDSYHRLGPREFAKVHNVDIPAMVRRLNSKPVIRVEAGAFVGYFEQRQYRLGPTKEGILSAVRKMVRLCAEDRGGILALAHREPADQQSILVVTAKPQSTASFAFAGSLGENGVWLRGCG
jgi:hypothetical protein